jgi:hypothetical protein
MRIKKVGALELRTLLFKRKTSNLILNEVVKNGLIYLTRGFTFSTFIRTDAVKDYVPNPYMGAFEDYVIT